MGHERTAAGTRELFNDDSSQTDTDLVEIRAAASEAWIGLQARLFVGASGYVEFLITDGTTVSELDLNDDLNVQASELAPIPGGAVFSDFLGLLPPDSLWATTGTAAGTEPIATCPGDCRGFDVVGRTGAIRRRRSPPMDN